RFPADACRAGSGSGRSARKRASFGARPATAGAWNFLLPYGPADSVMAFLSNRHPALAYCWRIMVSGLASPAEAPSHMMNRTKGCSQTGSAGGRTSIGADRRRVVRRKRDGARPARPIAPGVIGAALHHGVARREMDFRGVEHERDLTLEH